MFTVGRGMFSQVFYDVDYLTRKLGPFFTCSMSSVGAYGHQTAILFEPPSEQKRGRVEGTRPHFRSTSGNA